MTTSNLTYSVLQSARNFKSKNGSNRHLLGRKKGQNGLLKEVNTHEISNIEKIEAPRLSGDRLQDQISQFAFNHGIDPKMFVGTDP